MLFFSASKLGFFDSSICLQLPGDAVEITQEEHTALLTGQSEGLVIVAAEDGRPILIPPPPVPPPTRAEIEAKRLRAYADPVTGSDRHFSEAQRESLLGHTEAAEAATALGLARFEEIQAAYPWPVE